MIFDQVIKKIASKYIKKSKIRSDSGKILLPGISISTLNNGLISLYMEGFHITLKVDLKSPNGIQELENAIKTMINLPKNVLYVVFPNV